MTTDKKITVTAAINEGFHTAVYPCYGIFFGLLLGIGGIGTWLHHYWLWAVGFAIAAVAAILYSGRKITLWRIWAFAHTENIHELQATAISMRLIPGEDDAWQERLLLKSAAEKKQLEQIKLRLAGKIPVVNAFTDDPAVPETTLIYGSSAVILTLAWSGIVLGAIALAIPLLGLSFISAGVGILIYNHKVETPKKHRPTIILSNEGIETYSAGFNEWKNISHEEVKFFGPGDNSHYSLVYDHPRGSEDLELQYLKTDVKTLNHLLYIYRMRYEQKNHNR